MVAGNTIKMHLIYQVKIEISRVKKNTCHLSSTKGHETVNNTIFCQVAITPNK